MRRGLRNGTVSIRLSVCPNCRLMQQCAVGLLLWARRAGDIDRVLQHGWRRSSNGAGAASASSVTLTVAVGGRAQT